MSIEHFFALLPLLILLLFSMIFYGRGLIHVMTFAYAAGLGFMAVGNDWELIFFPVILVTAIIAIILFTFSMTRGNWV